MNRRGQFANGASALSTTDTSSAPRTPASSLCPAAWTTKHFEYVCVSMIVAARSCICMSVSLRRCICVSLTLLWTRRHRRRMEPKEDKGHWLWALTQSYTGNTAWIRMHIVYPLTNTLIPHSYKFTFHHVHMQESAAFRTHCRLPVLSWFNRRRGNTLVRCSQPKVCRGGGGQTVAGATPKPSLSTSR